MKITVKDSAVIITVGYYIPWGQTWTSTFIHNCNSAHEAQLMASRLREDYEQKMKEIRRKSYEQGWKDKSKKVARETWHSSSLPE